MPIGLQSQDSNSIHVTAETSFLANRLGSRVGFLECTLTIWNTTHVTATMPFIAFSVFGLRWKSNPGWLQESATGRGGRHMIRFRMESDPELAAAGNASPCKLILPFTMEKGGSVSILPDIDEPLSSFSDITLYYVVGAGNFTPLRSSIVIPASAVKAALVQSFPWLASPPHHKSMIERMASISA